jgi:hypothetical protein
LHEGSPLKGSDDSAIFNIEAADYERLAARAQKAGLS